jgi:hypothetical protein
MPKAHGLSDRAHSCTGFNHHHQLGALALGLSDVQIIHELVSRRMASRDAYMLVYMLRGATPGGPPKIQQPPQRALDVVLQMNQNHANACATFSAR